MKPKTGLFFGTQLINITALLLMFLTAGCSKTPPDPRRNIIKKSVQELLGTPYQWGGTSTKGLDCSGFVRKVYLKVGIKLPHNAAKQFKLGKKVKKKDLKYGDVVFFNTKPLYKMSGCCFPCLLFSSSVPMVYGVTHNGIYIGNGKFAHASSKAGVRIDRLDDPYWKPRYIGARRYLH